MGYKKLANTAEQHGPKIDKYYVPLYALDVMEEGLRDTCEVSRLKMKHYRIGELARRCGLSPRTIDYYTQLGLLEPVGRTGGNYRLYGPDALDQIGKIRALQARRLSLAEIVQRLAPEHGSLDPDVIEWLHQASGELDRLHAELVEICPKIRSTLDRAGRHERAERPTLDAVARHALLHTRGLAALLGSLVVDLPTSEER